MRNPTRFQQAALATPEAFDLICPGGRGGGKTTALFFLILRHAVQYGAKARILFTKRSYPALKPTFAEFMAFLSAQNVAIDRSNLTDLIIVVNGCEVTFGPLIDMSHYRARWQGQSFSMVVVDEGSSHYDASLVDALYGNLRSPDGVPVRLCVATNPGGGSGWIKRRWLDAATSYRKGEPFLCKETGRMTCVLHSVVTDNEFLDIKTLEATLRAQASGDEARYNIMRFGDFAAQVGQFFPLRECNFVHIPRTAKLDPAFSFRAGLDHGSRAPFAFVLCAKATDNCLLPDGSMMPRGSYIALAEAHSADPDAGYSRASRTVSISEIAVAIHRLHEKWHAPRIPAIADAATFADHGAGRTLASEYQLDGVHIKPGRKGLRSKGLQLMRNLIAAADLPGRRELPALYINRPSCPYLTQSLENAVADEADIEDIADGPHLHVLDALRYLLLTDASDHVASSQVSCEPIDNILFGTTFPSDNAIKRQLERERRSRAVFGRCRRSY